MKATTRIIVHNGNDSRYFDEGETIPDDWVAGIRNPVVVDEPLPHLVAEAKAEGREAPGPDPFVGLRGTRTVDDVLTWVNDPETVADRRDRAAYALDAERTGKSRSTLIATLEQLVTDLAKAGE